MPALIHPPLPPRVPPNPSSRLTTLLDDPDILDYQLIHRLPIPLWREPSEERLHLLRPPLRAREEQVGEPLGRVGRKGTDAEWDQVWGFVG